MDEFNFISRLLSPLAAGESGAFGLSDDGAVLAPPAGHELIFTKDALVEGVHFIGNELPADIARKALRVNLSDIAAMGAKPRAYMLALMLPASVDEAWLTSFAQGLKMDQTEFSITLIGGDTTRTTGPLALSVTMIGVIPIGKTLRRNGTKIGDTIYVSGAIGDAALGLLVANRTAKANEFLLSRYRIPQPRIALGQSLRDVATSCMDISDGLLQDLGHICQHSHVGAVIEWDKIPLSEAAHSREDATPEIILTGGDDYELLFTAPAGLENKLPLITPIGTITGGSKIQLLDAQGKELNFSHEGYRHF